MSIEKNNERQKASEENKSEALKNAGLSSIKPDQAKDTVPQVFPRTSDPSLKQQQDGALVFNSPAFNNQEKDIGRIKDSNISKEDEEKIVKAITQLGASGTGSQEIRDAAEKTLRNSGAAALPFLQKEGALKLDGDPERWRRAWGIVNDRYDALSKTYDFLTAETTMTTTDARGHENTFSTPITVGKIDAQTVKARTEELKHIMSIFNDPSNIMWSTENRTQKVAKLQKRIKDLLDSDK